MKTIFADEDCWQCNGTGFVATADGELISCICVIERREERKAESLEGANIQK